MDEKKDHDLPHSMKIFLLGHFLLGMLMIE